MRRAMRQEPGPGDVPAVQRAMEAGIMAGLLAALPMGLLTMIASATWRHAGFFTPAYRVAAILDPNPLQASLEEAATGSAFYFDQQPMFAGGAAHLGVGCVFGVVFALLAYALRPRGPAALGAGVAYGLAVMAFMALAGLPLAERVLGGGEAISGLPGAVGWPTFVAVHVLYGLVLGGWLLLRPADIGLARKQPARDG
jgi:uncharacterized membrane protein YagU involved in acid resistance